VQKWYNLILINEIFIRSGKVTGALSIGFLFGYLAYKVCIVFALDSDTKITAINARRTVHDWLELYELLPTLSSAFCIRATTSLADGFSTYAARKVFSCSFKQSFIEATA
jgi:hypothetical protein